MKPKRVHYWSGLILALFAGFHLLNHLAVLSGPEAHLATMEVLRKVYRNLVVEWMLLVAVFLQIATGLRQAYQKGLKQAGWAKYQVWSGLYLAVFFLIHVSAVMMGRFVLKVDTNLYFGAAGLNIFPFNLFFVPYYSLAIMAFFTHIASIHAQKSKAIGAANQAKIIVAIGLITTILIVLGMTDFARGLFIPPTYKF
ncbi:MAG: hypothetical protein EAZ70_09415 [Runella slithyformis]|nr:MAG: hypothetical protein EAY79_00360 [Runella slithyformis]TAF25968.1 MAG: hypothetical protein EAZ70_09415 [Runella slithyformis]TAF45070.1 MAG: hypothetical protein EAZ63_11485 [Runella slithyformis]TAF80068.1 MAG: hypothetical protein EAZ50_09820 [Runella slithyformis]